MKYILSKIKAILKAIFINWWWGFWRRSKPAVIIDLEEEPIAGLAGGDFASLFSDDPVGGVLEEACRVTPMPELWNKRRVLLLSIEDKKVEAIKLVMKFTDVGLKEAKGFIDSHENCNHLLLGPLKEYTPGSVVSDFNFHGCVALIVVMDSDGDFMADDDMEDEVDILYRETFEGLYFRPCLPDMDQVYASIELDDCEDDEDLDWLDELEEEPDDDNQPDDIEFGHEDTELEPNRY